MTLTKYSLQTVYYIIMQYISPHLKHKLISICTRSHDRRMITKLATKNKDSKPAIMATLNLPHFNKPSSCFPNWHPMKHYQCA